MSDGGYDGNGFPRGNREPVDHVTPRDLLERAEHIPEPTQEELAHALGRVLTWIMDGGTLVRIGERAMIVAYKLRPDVVRGVTLEGVAGMSRLHGRNKWRSYVNKLQRQFSRTFGIRGLNDHSKGGRKPWGPFDDGKSARSHGVVDSHLKLVNRFEEWRRFHDEGQGAIPRDLAARQRLLKDLQPITKFVNELEAGL